MRRPHNASVPQCHIISSQKDHLLAAAHLCVHFIRKSSVLSSDHTTLHSTIKSILDEILKHIIQVYCTQYISTARTYIGYHYLLCMLHVTILTSIYRDREKGGAYELLYRYYGMAGHGFSSTDATWAKKTNSRH